ncbi:hypothetical protein [Asanoa iriomotensis]|uniref:hypothetical protein n=1 Tax=Asanoa iriomotensis TaxID=234613 RepID=UPI001943505B|nr:hypothetical protein [Asanoa iriomotensis]
MAGVSEREISRPCLACGKPVAQSGRGRKRLYCDRTCRQRAYESRRANTAGRAPAAEPAERIIERRVPVEVDVPVPVEHIVKVPVGPDSGERMSQIRWPVTSYGWVLALDELAQRLRDLRIPFTDYYQLHSAALSVLAELEKPEPGTGRRWANIKVEDAFAQTPPELLIETPDGVLEPSPAGHTAAARLLQVARADHERVTEGITLQWLASRIDMPGDIHAVREGLTILIRNSRAVLLRNGEIEHPAWLYHDASFTLVLRDYAHPDGLSRPAPPRPPTPPPSPAADTATGFSFELPDPIETALVWLIARAADGGNRPTTLRQLANEAATSVEAMHAAVTALVHSPAPAWLSRNGRRVRPERLTHGSRFTLHTTRETVRYFTTTTTDTDSTEG